LNKNDPPAAKLAAVSPMVAGWSHDWGKLHTSFPKALERERGVPEGTIRKDYYKNAELKEKDERPKPGDFYTLVGNVSRMVDGKLTKIWAISHVGIIIDAIGNVWETADCGQCGKNAAAYKHRIFDLEQGTLILNPPEDDGKVPDGGTRFLDGWINIDELFNDYAK